MKNEVKIIWLDSVDSTNEEVKRRSLEMDSMTVIAARDQTSGRGQRGNKWLVKPRENLTFSLLVRFGDGGLPRLPANGQFCISEVASMAVADHLKDAGMKASIKWPNDIYIKDRKICGMLIENKLDASGVSCSIIGIGLNVMQTDFPAMLQNPTSMALETRCEYDLEEELSGLASRLCGGLQKWLSDTGGMEALRREYTSNLYRLGEWREYNDNLGCCRFKGRIYGVSKDGRLLVEDACGMTRTFAFKEISYVI